MIDKRNKILERMKNLTQKKFLKEIQQQVINEDLILSKKIILENNLEKKLNSRKKRLSEKVFEETVSITDNLFVWNSENNAGKEVASGIYFYYIKTTDGKKFKGKIAIER